MAVSCQLRKSTRCSTNYELNSMSNAFASFRSSVSKPSVNQAVDRSEKIAGFVPSPPIALEPRHAHRRTQLPGLRLPCPRDLNSTIRCRRRDRH